MTKKQLAENYLCDLFNDANHADALARCAQAEFESGDHAAAISSLKQLLERPASMLQMRTRDTIRAIEEAQREAEMLEAG